MLHGPRFSLVFTRALGRVVVHVHGAVDDISAGALKDRLADIIDGQGNRQVVLDLRTTTSVDAAGLGVLADALQRMDSYGGELLLSGPTRPVEKQLRAFGLDGITPEWMHPARGGHRRWPETAPRKRPVSPSAPGLHSRGRSPDTR